MRILLINVTKDKGSTGRIVSSLFDEFKKQGHEVKLIYGRGPKTKHSDSFIKKTCEFESKICHFISLFTGNMYGLMLLSTNRIKREIKKTNPDIVNLHCINGYFVNIYKLLKWLAKKNYKTVLTMHADFMMTGGCGITLDCKNYLNCQCKNCKHVKKFNGRLSLNRTHHFYKKMANAISLFKNKNISISCVSPWLSTRYKESPIYSNIKVRTILNPVDSFFFEKPSSNPFSGKNNCLYVTPDMNDYVKCGWLIKDIAKNRPDINFYVVCSNDIDYKFEEKNITYIKGGLSKQELLNYYYHSDSTIILSKTETFSMVVAESLACGTPVYGFKCGGPESICLDEFCNFSEFGDIENLSRNLSNIIINKDLIKDLAFKKYNVEKIAKDYLDLYNKTIE